MAIQLECISLIIPIKTIEEKLGNWRWCVADYDLDQDDFDVLYDDHIVKVGGAMNSFSMMLLLDEWQARGFKLYTGTKAKPKKWADVCVVPSEIPCDWLKIKNGFAFFKGEKN